MGIVESRSLWASDIRYMNDSAELKHTADLIRAEVTDYLAAIIWSGWPESRGIGARLRLESLAGINGIRSLKEMEDLYA